MTVTDKMDAGEYIHEVWSDAFHAFTVAIGAPPAAVDYSLGDTTEETVVHTTRQAAEHAQASQERAVAAGLTDG